MLSIQYCSVFRIQYWRNWKEQQHSRQLATNDVNDITFSHSNGNLWGFYSILLNHSLYSPFTGLGIIHWTLLGFLLFSLSLSHWIEKSYYYYHFFHCSPIIQTYVLPTSIIEKLVIFVQSMMLSATLDGRLIIYYLFVFSGNLITYCLLSVEGWINWLLSTKKGNNFKFAFIFHQIFIPEPWQLTYIQIFFIHN